MSRRRHAAKRDTDEGEIVEAIRSLGASVLYLAGLATGCPDLLVGYRGVNLLVEVKGPLGPRGGDSGAGQRQTPAQVDWSRRWAGAQPAVVRTPAEAIALLLLVGVEKRTLRVTRK